MARATPQDALPSRRDALSCGVAGIALIALAGCKRGGENAPFQAIDMSGIDGCCDFRLQGDDDRTVQLADFRGRCVLLFFGFTQCPDVCPTALSRAAAVMQKLGSDATMLQVIFVTVDTERDTSAVLREYTRAFHPSFIGLHADLATTASTAKAFKVSYRKVPTGGSYTMDHTATSYVFDPAGRLRLAVRHEQDATSLAADIAHLLMERP